MSKSISVQGISKKYRKGVLGYKSVWEDTRRLARRTLGLPVVDKDTFWALESVSFDVNEGEVIGIVGSNGAGKSTLLKVLSRITRPDRGSAILMGRVSSLLEVGTGFHPELTGRENIFLNGSILGMSRPEIRSKLDEIIEFSGVREFVDTPVKRYSSGMYVRLAFSVSAHLSSDILIVDEVLAVGDAEFQKKCLTKLEGAAGSGKTVLFVSHNLSALKTLCPRSIVLERGKVVMDDSTALCMNYYLNRNLAQGTSISGTELDGARTGLFEKEDPYIRCLRVDILDNEGKPRAQYSSAIPLSVLVAFEVRKPAPGLLLKLSLDDDNGQEILETFSNDDARVDGLVRLDTGKYKVKCSIPADLLASREYFLTLHFIVPKIEHIVFNRLLRFDVRFEGYNNHFPGARSGGYLRPKVNWAMGA
ncbi:MAG: ATP-binding cassette domain-containing protein [Spirochaetia bacterium]|nr:ATP-binding cassette domain-containing protein [Spirochaetia bacterium]